MATLGAALSVALLSVLKSFQLVPLQFSGDFIELAVLFIVLAIIAAVFGARGVAGISMSIAKWFILIFIVLAVLSIIL